MSVDQETGRRVPPYDREDHKYMILHQDEWPIWPRLPVKNTKDYRLGMIMSHGGLFGEIDPDKPIVVRLGTMFLVEKMDNVEYPNLDALLDAGWVVD
jgi:hypothetical protein